VSNRTRLFFCGKTFNTAQKGKRRERKPEINFMQMKNSKKPHQYGKNGWWKEEMLKG
jgi:hypothetical protein